VIYPTSLAESMQQYLEKLDVTVRILKGKELEGMNLLLAVGKASDKEPCVVVMEYKGDKSNPDDCTALVGKGVTYDTGGLSIKPSNYMESMKSDMSGSAVVAGVIANLAQNKVKKNVIGIVGLVENAIAGNAYKPDDILKSYSGRNVEIVNTDAEGRLVLADILSYVQEKYKPSEIIDLATLTGAIFVALGTAYAGLFANDNILAQALLDAGSYVGEELWRMPLCEKYTKALDSKVAEINHCGAHSAGAGSSTAAAFLESFIEKDVKWAHLDIAGVAFDKGRASATGFGVRLLNRYFKVYETV
jgi:leucyl aminopeptidase